MTGDLRLAGRTAQAGAIDASWDLSFDVEDGRLAGETPVDHIHGGLRVAGGVEQGRWFSRGEMKFDSLFINGVQVTQMLGPFYLDARQLLVGSWAEKDRQGKLPPRQLTAEVCEGLLATDASISLEDDGKFTLACTLDNASLARITQELGTSTADISGKTFGVLQMTGTSRGKHTWRGGGNVRLRDANLYKLPQALTLLK
jgi:hypothetical protein